ncbi:MAG TPA: flagellar hook-basal body complex protein FliE [Acetobacteraceae bacterium]|jgi:flagellar hook-basal body complex protein FliE|nr:flagellar hook-basal body complex protein FliE [Acetobacteraceae bacterium]
MSTIPTIVVTPSAAANAYARVDRGDAAADAGAGGETGSFGATLERALQGAIDSGHAAEGKATEAIAGGGNLTDVVTALARAELTLQSATAIRDRVVQAYQDIIKMPI